MSVTAAAIFDPAAFLARYCSITLTISDRARAVGFLAACPNCGAHFLSADEWAGSICRRPRGEVA